MLAMVNLQQSDELFKGLAFLVAIEIKIYTGRIVFLPANDAYLMRRMYLVD
jgi:hypothetical protein